MKQYLSLVVIAGALLTAAAAPALAAPENTPKNTTGSPPFVADNPRDAAIHDCSVQSSKWSNSSFQNENILSYESCMAEHQQMQ